MWIFNWLDKIFKINKDVLVTPVKLPTLITERDGLQYWINTGEITPAIPDCLIVKSFRKDGSFYWWAYNYYDDTCPFCGNNERSLIAGGSSSLDRCLVCGAFIFLSWTYDDDPMKLKQIKNNLEVK